MGIVSLFPEEAKLVIEAHFFLYGSKATAALAIEMQKETENMWNEPQAVVRIGDIDYKVEFKILYDISPELLQSDVEENTNPLLNFIRIEEWHESNISFVDGLGSNTGYYLLTNLYVGSTTAAHEFGHTIGLPHPENMDLRGKGRPGIMYARGTLVDPMYQYDPTAAAGGPGGTMHPMHRKVTQQDIFNLNIPSLNFQQNTAVIGALTNVWHEEIVKPLV